MSKVECIYKSIDEAIAAYLRRNSMTQEQLAAEVGMNPNTFSWKRRGIHEWKLSEAAKVCDILGIPLDLGLTNERKPVA